MTTHNAQPKDAAREAIEELAATRPVELYLDIALDAIAHTLLKDPRFPRFGLDPEKAGMGEVIAALVKAGLMPPDAANLPGRFEEAVAQVLYPGGDEPEKQLKGIATKLHDDLLKALDRLEKAPGNGNVGPPAG